MQVRGGGRGGWGTRARALREHRAEWLLAVSGGGFDDVAGDGGSCDHKTVEESTEKCLIDRAMIHAIDFG